MALFGFEVKALIMITRGRIGESSPSLGKCFANFLILHFAVAESQIIESKISNKDFLFN